MTDTQAQGSPAGERPFRILGAQQIAIGGLSLTEMKQFWAGLLGLPITDEVTLERENVTEAILRIGLGPTAVELDLMQPLDPAGKPAVHEKPLNHIGFWVDKLEDAAAYLKAQGVQIAGDIRVGAAGHRVAFVHPKSTGGVLLELIQATPEIIANFDRQVAMD